MANQFTLCFLSQFHPALTRGWLLFAVTLSAQTGSILVDNTDYFFKYSTEMYFVLLETRCEHSMTQNTQD